MPQPRRHKERLHCRVKKSTKKWLDGQAAAHGINVGEIVDKIAEAYLDKGLNLASDSGTIEE